MYNFVEDGIKFISMMTVKCAAEIVRELNLHPSNSNIAVEKTGSQIGDIEKRTSFSGLAKEMELANQQRVAAAAAAAHILSAAAAVAQAAKTNATEPHQQHNRITMSPPPPPHGQNNDLMASVTSKRTPKSKLTFSVDSLLSTKSASITEENKFDRIEREDGKAEDLSLVAGEEDEDDNDDEINVNDDDNDYIDDEDDEEDGRNSSFSPCGVDDNKHSLTSLPKLAMPTPLLPGSSPHLSGSSPYLAGYLAAVAAANGSSLHSNRSQVPPAVRPPLSSSGSSSTANILSAINRWPSPPGGLPPGFPFSGLQNPFLRPGNYIDYFFILAFD